MKFRASRVLASGKAMFVVQQEGHIKVYDGLKTIRRKSQLVICHQQCA